MGATLEAPLDETTRAALGRFFLVSSAYVTGKEAGEPEHEELAARWRERRTLDDTVAAIAASRDEEALAAVPRFAARPSVFIGLLARMLPSTRRMALRGQPRCTWPPAAATWQLRGSCWSAEPKSTHATASGATPLDRALNCRKENIARLLMERGAAVTGRTGASR
jgi:hypothetical protein